MFYVLANFAALASHATIFTRSTTPSTGCVTSRNSTFSITNVQTLSQNRYAFSLSACNESHKTDVKKFLPEIFIISFPSEKLFCERISAVLNVELRLTYLEINFILNSLR